MPKKQEKNPLFERISIKLTEWMGSTQSLIVHTLLFIGMFALIPFGFKLDQVMLILTTGVSLEAIYLALFIQMTVNRNTESLEDVEEDIDEIQEDVEDIEGEFDEIQEDVEDLEENVDDITRTTGKPVAQQSIEKQLADINTTLLNLQEQIKSMQSEK